MKIIDFAINWNSDEKEDFLAFLEKNAKLLKLSFLWINEKNFKDVTKKLENSELKINVLLDTEATFHLKGDPYTRICYAVKDAGGVIINDPDRAKLAIDKSVMHFELADADILTPYTIVVRNWEPNNFRLTPKEKKDLGVPFIIKPALGYGQQGVIRDAVGSVNEIARARKFDKGDNFLLQEKIYPINLNGDRAWFRVLNVFDKIVPFWWNDQTNYYKHVTYEEFNKYSLLPLVKIVSRISEMTKMVWFSTEIAITEKDKKRKFVTIDYVNDQCDMSTVDEKPDGIPRHIVEDVADHIISTAQRYIKNENAIKKYVIYLDGASINLKGLGTPSYLLNSRNHKLEIKKK